MVMPYSIVSLLLWLMTINRTDAVAISTDPMGVLVLCST